MKSKQTDLILTALVMLGILMFVLANVMVSAVDAAVECPTATPWLPTPAPTEPGHYDPWGKTFLPMFYNGGGCNWQMYCEDVYCSWECH